jgi:hypothetical protein
MDQNTTMVVRPTALVVSKQERIRILTQWKDSGLSAREYSQRIGVPMTRLYDWQRKLKPSSPRVPETIPFVEVPQVAMQPDWGAEVMTRCGVVRLSASVAPTWAAHLIRELSQC